MDLYNINAALSQGNALTEQTQLYNENIKQARDDVKNFYQGQVQKDNQQADIDDAVYSVHDAMAAIGAGTKVGALKDAYKDFQASDGVGDFLARQGVRAEKANPIFYGAGRLGARGLKGAGKLLGRGASAAGSGAVALGSNIQSSVNDMLDPVAVAERGDPSLARRPAAAAAPDEPDIGAPAVPDAPAAPAAPPGPAAPTAPAEPAADARVSRSLNDDNHGADADDGNGAPVRPDEAPVAPANQLEENSLRASQGRAGQVSQGIAQVNEPETALQRRNRREAEQAAQEPEPAPEPIPQEGAAAETALERRDRLEAEQLGTIDAQGQVQPGEDVRAAAAAPAPAPAPAAPAPAPAPAAAAVPDEPVAPAVPEDLRTTQPAPGLVSQRVAQLQAGRVPTAPPLPPGADEDEEEQTLFQKGKAFLDTPGAKTGMKIAGNIGGGLDIYDYFKQGGKFQEANSEENWGDRLTSLGTIFDVVGTAIPGLEAVGGILSAAGEVTSTIGKHIEDTNQITVKDPQNETNQLDQLQTKVAPSFQSLGLAATQNAHLAAQSGVATF